MLSWSHHTRRASAQARQNWRVFVFGGVVIYDKPALSFEEQADQLIARGLVADRSTPSILGLDSTTFGIGIDLICQATTAPSTQ